MIRKNTTFVQKKALLVGFKLNQLQNFDLGIPS